MAKLRRCTLNGRTIAFSLALHELKSIQKRFQDISKFHQKSFEIVANIVENRSLDEAWAELGARQGVVGLLRAVLGRFGRLLGTSWGCLGGFDLFPRASSGVLGRFGGVLGLIFVPRGSLIEALHLGCHF